MNEDGNKYKYYLKELSYLIKDKIDVFVKEVGDKNSMNDDYIDATSIAYCDMVSSMKELSQQFGIDEKEVALDILDEKDILNIPGKYWKKL